MIRDPSDGSVKTPEEINPYANEINSVVAKPRAKEITVQSGLAPLNKDQNDASRLKRSREQLENYKRTGVWKCQE